MCVLCGRLTTAFTLCLEPASFLTSVHRPRVDPPDADHRTDLDGKCKQMQEFLVKFGGGWANTFVDRVVCGYLQCHHIVLGGGRWMRHWWSTGCRGHDRSRPLQWRGILVEESARAQTLPGLQARRDKSTGRSRPSNAVRVGACHN